MPPKQSDVLACLNAMRKADHGKDGCLTLREIKALGYEEAFYWLARHEFAFHMGTFVGMRSKAFQFLDCEVAHELSVCATRVKEKRRKRARPKRDGG